MSAFGVVLRYLTMACRKTLVYHAVAVVEGTVFFLSAQRDEGDEHEIGRPPPVIRNVVQYPAIQSVGSVSLPKRGHNTNQE